MPSSTSWPFIPQFLPLPHPPQVGAPDPTPNTLPVPVISHSPSPLHSPPLPSLSIIISCCSFLSCYITYTQSLCKQNTVDFHSPSLPSPVAKQVTKGTSKGTSKGTGKGGKVQHNLQQLPLVLYQYGGLHICSCNQVCLQVYTQGT